MDLARRKRLESWVLYVCAAYMACAALFAGTGHTQQRGITVELKQDETANSAVAESVILYPRSYALVIGNDDYRDESWPKLSNAVRDAREVASLLETKGFEVTLRTNLDGRSLEDELETFFFDRGQDPRARMFVWYAGHGYTEASEGYLVPVDAPDPGDVAQFRRRSLSLRRMGEYARGANAHHVLVIFDSCFAGTVFEVQRDTPPAAITHATTRPVRQFITSGDAGQTVSDDGTFRRMFVEALSGQRRADLNGDGYVTASELGLFLSDRITNYTNGLQTPRYGKLRDPNWDEGDFVFALQRPRTPAPAVPVQKDAAQTSDPSIAVWLGIKDSGDPADFETFLGVYPNSPLAPFARNRLAALSKESDTALEAASTDAASQSQTAVPENHNAAAPPQGEITMRVGGTSFVNVRAGPSTKANKIGRVETGSNVTVLGKAEGGTWFSVRLENGQRGYIYAPLLSLVLPDAVETREAALGPGQPGISIADIIAGVSEAVVRVRADSKSTGTDQLADVSPQFEEFFRRFFEKQEAGAPRSVVRRGSGLVVHEKGYVITAAHLLDGAERISIQAANSLAFLPATIVSRDDERDVALLKFDPVKPPAVAAIATSRVPDGDWAAAIGGPLGFRLVGRPIRVAWESAEIRLDSQVEWDAGTPLFDRAGRVIGMVQGDPSANYNYRAADLTRLRPRIAALLRHADPSASLREPEPLRGVPVASPPVPNERLADRSAAVARQSLTIEYGERTAGGFLVSNEGHVATDAQLLVDPAGRDDSGNMDNQPAYIVSDDGQRHRADIIGADNRTNIALLHAPSLRTTNAPPLDRNPSGIRIGNQVMVANKSGHGGSLVGFISSAIAPFAGSDTDAAYIDLPDASLQGGQPVFDLEGRVIGANQTVFSRNTGGRYERRSLLIPLSTVLFATEQLRQYGRMRRGWLGVQIQTVTREFAEAAGLDTPRGALIAQVGENSPAERSGLQAGDVILEFAGRDVISSRQLPTIVGSTPPDTPVEAVIQRAGRTRSLTVILGELEDVQPPARLASRTQADTALNDLQAWGVTLKPLGREEVRSLGLKDRRTAAQIADVRAGSPAADVGLQSGDLIERVLSTSVATPLEVLAAIRKARLDNKKSIALLIRRSDGTNMFVPMRLD